MDDRSNSYQFSKVSTVDDRLHWPAPERNKDAILQVLRSTYLTLQAKIGYVSRLPLAAGNMPPISPPDCQIQSGRLDRTPHLASIQAWLDWTGLTKAPEPLCLDTRNRPWPIQSADAVLCINMIHISPWESCISMFDEASTILSREGVLYLYGPFTIGGKHTSQSNIVFDESLKSLDPSWGVRDLNDVSTTARKHGFCLSANVKMPANNLSVIFKKTHQQDC